MKENCNIVKDLLPLYAENLLSDDSKKYVRDHLEDCDDCKEELEKMECIYAIENDTDILPLKSIVKKLNNKKKEVTATVLITVMMFFVIFNSYYYTEEYVKYSDGLIKFFVSPNGQVELAFNEKANTCRIATFKDGKDGYVYEVIGRNSLANKIRGLLNMLVKLITDWPVIDLY
ncbi:MAG: zf-HC2 domain-containing protein [Tissierellia bacterium]|nr:zf-HC2 domain-containing protein [Tissierellia bacterium]